MLRPERDPQLAQRLNRPIAELVAALDANLHVLDRKRRGAVEGPEPVALLQSIMETVSQRTVPLMRRLGVLT